MGRVMVREPSAFLLDEPLSNLDAKLRVQMRAEISSIQRRLAVATLYVTHDQIEAMTMGDRVAVMRDGVLQQCASPQLVYDQPANLFVAAFIGSPAMNLYEGSIEEAGESRLAVVIGAQKLLLAQEWRSKLSHHVGQRVVVGIRPEAVHPATSEAPAGSTLRVKVNLVEVLGPELLVHFQLDAAKRVVADEEVLEELSASGGLPAAKAAEGLAKASPRATIGVGEELVLFIELDQLHFFDPDTGAAIG
jgi:multiple sugar transport system ATP-binding protein